MSPSRRLGLVRILKCLQTIHCQYHGIGAKNSFRRLGAELKNTADETPFLELARRGYDLSKLRENDETETSAEIVKIG